MSDERAASISILGCRVDAVRRDDAVARIVAAARGDRPFRIVTLGVEMIMYAQRDARFRETIAHADLLLCDTIGVLLASRLRGGPLRERVTGVDLIEPLAEASARTGDVRFFFFGGAPGVAERAAQTLRERYPGIRIAGIRDGFFAPDDNENIIAQIAASGANILLAGLGSPKQEYWLETNLAATTCPVGIGIGGSFDVIAGTKRRAPRVLQRLGLEWLFRLMQEPARWRRQLALPQFAVAVMREMLMQRGTIRS
jgi:N-acetylglucosaminyldiphosphoundecaprenol N-acetyl-beta-D-mannosaminyltransferase